MAKTHIASVLLILLLLSTLPFGFHAFDLGLRGLNGLADTSRIFTPNAALTNFSIFSHMVVGAIITVLAPLQLSHWIRTQHPKLHRITGRVLVFLAIPTSLGGFGYILLKGTVGGPAMDIAFGFYGALLFLAAVQTIRFARARQMARHQRWALRCFFLLIGSWIYRVHYALWFALFGEIGHTSQFSGSFDLIQNWAFYAPYLIVLEIFFVRRYGPFWDRTI